MEVHDGRKRIAPRRRANDARADGNARSEGKRDILNAGVGPANRPRLEIGQPCPRFMRRQRVDRQDIGGIKALDKALRVGSREYRLGRSTIAGSGVTTTKTGCAVDRRERSQSL